MGAPKPHPHDQPNGAPHSADEGRHAYGAPSDDHRWLRSVVENSSENVTIVDPDGTLRYASPAFGRMLGYDPDEVVGNMNVLDHIHPDDLPHVLEETEKALSQGGVTSNEAEYRFRHADGSWRWVESIATYLLEDPYVGVVVQSRDVTERKEAEERIRFQAQLLDAVGEAVIALDLDGKVLYWNRAAEGLYGWSEEEAMGRNLREMVVPEDLRERAEEIASHLRDGRSWSGEFVVRRRDGTTIPVEATDTPVFGEDGEQIGVVGVLRDVTDRKRAEEALRRSEAEVFSVLESITDAFFSLDKEWRFSYVNSQAEVLFEREREDLIGERIQEDPDFYPHYRKAVAEGTTARFEAYYPPLEKWFSVRAYPSKSGLSVYLQDITERRQAEEALKESEQRFKSTFEDAGIGMALSTPDGRYLRANRAFCELLGYSEEGLHGMTYREITHPDDLEEDVELGSRLLEGEARTFSMEKRYVRKDGSLVWVELTVSLLRGPSGEPLYSISQIQDLSERKRMEEQLQRQALHDSLTGLPNRKLFMDRLAHALERTRRTKSRKVALLFMDLDGFKVVNDSLGHEVGDLLLVLVTERLRRSLRPEDTLARLGGDEFVVLIEDVETPADAVEVARRIIEELRRPFVLEGRGLFASASIGIALGDAQSKTPRDLLRDADTAMYRAKDEHADYRAFEPGMYERAVGRLEVENDLRRAIEAEEFVVHYQPIVDLKTGEARGAEALVRWNHPQHGLLEPSGFMPVLEESGLVVPVGEKVLEEACLQARRWQEDHRLPSLAVSVNLSAVQLRRPDLACSVEETLRKTGLEARRLSLDVTETAYIRVLEEMTPTLNRLKDMGVNISIDDFGVGYSSLSYLKRLPADTLKIDKSFVRGLGEDVEDTAIVQMVVDLAHTLGMRVVAEGVESADQAALVKEMGCELAQGFYFSRPLPPEEVPGFLAG